MYLKQILCPESLLSFHYRQIFHVILLRKYMRNVKFKGFYLNDIYLIFNEELLSFYILHLYFSPNYRFIFIED